MSSPRPLSPRDTDVAPPRAPRWLRGMGIGCLLLWASPYLLFGGCLARDRLFGTYLDAPVRVASPDGALRFEADTDGVLRVVDTVSGKERQIHRLSTADYRRVEARWKGPRRVEMTGHIRYPCKASFLFLSWDVDRNRVTEVWSGRVVPPMPP